jgi:hypothetical protein
LYKLITVSGPEAVPFLQGQLTQDLQRLDREKRLLAAWCNPKGRVIVVLRVIALDDAIGLLVPADMAERVVQRLTLYRLRAKVEFAIEDDWQALVGPQEADPQALVRAGIATIDASNTEAHTPHMLNLDKLDAISFSKGCYTGQEVVARTEHRGKSKRRLMRYACDGPAVNVGDKVADGERNVGEVVNVAGNELLAVTPVELHEKTLSVDGSTLTPLGLPYDL